MLGVHVALYNPRWAYIATIPLRSGTDFVNNGYLRVGFLVNGRRFLDDLCIGAAPQHQNSENQ